MVLDVLLISISLIVLLAASYADLKTREVPDLLNYGFIFAILGIRTVFSFKLGWNILLEGVLGFAVFFILAIIFYHSNQWGGGDSKLLMGMGAAIGIAYPFNTSSLNLLWFLLALLFLGSIYGLAWMIAIAIRKRELFVKDIKKKFVKNKKNHLTIGILSFIFLILGLFYNPVIFLLLFPAVIYYLLIFVSVVEKSCFTTEIKVSKLVEGDWLAKNVTIKGKKLLKKKTLEKEDIKLLKNKINSVFIKEGVPFVPSFLFAYLLITFGNGVFPWVLGKIF